MKPRVAISSCLLGEKVRYDGDHKRMPILLDELSAHLEWIPVCPELEVGMGVPRERVQLVVSTENDGQRRMVGEETGRDWTVEIAQLAERRAAELAAWQLSGYIFKSRSPSCGLQNVKLYEGDSPPRSHGAGLFAEAIRTRWPRLPMVEETDLTTADTCREFLDRVRKYHAASGAGG